MSRKSLQNTRITVKRLNLGTVDAVGGVTQVKTTVMQVSGRVRQLNASEQPVGGKDGVASTHRFYCNSNDIRNADELVAGNKVYDVNSVNPTSDNNDSIEIDCTYRG